MFLTDKFIERSRPHPRRKRRRFINRRKIDIFFVEQVLHPEKYDALQIMHIAPGESEPDWQSQSPLPESRNFESQTP